MMIEAINQHLEREERLEQFRDEMEDVWIEYQRTGLHATSEEVFAWMDSSIYSLPVTPSITRGGCPTFQVAGYLKPRLMFPNSLNILTTSPVSVVFKTQAVISINRL